MENLNPIQQLDFVLQTLKEKENGFNFYDLYLKLKLAKEFDGNSLLESQLLNRLLEKLIRDNHVFTFSKSDDIVYAITVEGYLFIGYEKQIIIESALACRKNIRDFALTWGTVLAGIAASSLLIWQIYSYYNPVSTPINLKVKIEKKY